MFSLFTSNFARAGSLPHAVSIAVAPPYWWRNRLSYLPLAPDRTWLDLPAAEYDALFSARLALLDPATVFEDLRRLVDPSESAVLLCFESPQLKCHRRAVADFLGDSLGITVAELGFPTTPRYSELPMKPSRSPKLPLFDQADTTH